MANPKEVYDLLRDSIANHDAMIEELVVGLTWTYCASTGSGLCMTADSRSRSFEWPGSMKGKSVVSVSEWLKEWDAMKSSIAMAAINSVINIPSKLSRNTIKRTDESPNLSVFEYFSPLIEGKKCAVVGRYPGLGELKLDWNLSVIELNPGPDDFPASAAEFVLPDSEWVFLTGTSIANKTFPRLMELSQNANVVLMGPSVPHLEELADFGVDFIAGVNVVDQQRLKQVVAEGGGVNIFSDAVEYFIHDLGQKTLEDTKVKIKNVVQKRELLKDEMETWYKNINKGTYPKAFELVALDEELSLLDSQYKQMWDIRHRLSG